jgi:hypothetical protein
MQKPPPSALDDPEYATFAWGRYKRLMVWMGVASLGAVILCLGLLRYLAGPLSIHMYIATAGGVFFSVMLAAALMGLVFLSSGSGHDASIEDPFPQDDV